MTKQVQQAITPTHVLGSTGTADSSDLGYRALVSFKGDLGLGTSLTSIDVSGAAVFNDVGADVDFRVESDTNTHALFVDGGNSRVGINNSSPSQSLDVVGPARFQGIAGYGTKFHAYFGLRISGDNTLTLTISGGSGWAVAFDLYINGTFNSVNRRGHAHYKIYASQDSTGDTVVTVLPATGNLTIASAPAITARSASSLEIAFTTNAGANHGVSIDGICYSAARGATQVTNIVHVVV